MIIGIDVDGTLANGAPFSAPDVIADPDPKMVEIVKELYARGHVLCLWTCRADYIATAWLKRHDLLDYFNFINCSPLITDSIKPNFDLLIDNAVVRWAGQHKDGIFALLGPGQPNIPRDPTFSDTPPVAYLAGTGRAYIDMFEPYWVKAWDTRDFNKRIALFTICSHAKPYSKSFIHSTIRRALHFGGYLNSVDYIHVSSAGIIPSGAEMTYPFNAYDHDGANMTPEAMEYFEKRTGERIRHWLLDYGIHYDAFVVYLRYGKTFRAVTNNLDGGRMFTVEVNQALADTGEWARLPDPDDCLTHENNLRQLLDRLRVASRVARV